LTQVTQQPPADRQRLHQIGEVAEIVGLSLRTIRYYEEVGLVPPSGRSSGGFRLYTSGDVQRFRVVKAFKPLKFTLDEMRDLLGLLDRLDTGAVLDANERDRLTGYAAAADQRGDELREQLAAVDELSHLLKRRARAAASHRKRRASTR
jgi:DNA-binding transcriptional MerR regulator